MGVVWVRWGVLVYIRLSHSLTVCLIHSVSLRPLPPRVTEREALARVFAVCDHALP